MLVDVIRLRADGVKLSPEAVKAATPIRGDLRFGAYRLDTGVFYDAVLKGSPGAGGTSLIPDLTDAFIRKIKGQDMVIVGNERHGKELRSQAWWCKVVAG
jgi:hypothetical protein